MEKLQLYLNSLGIEQQKAFAGQCNTSVGYLRKAISNKQKLGAALSVRIESNSGGQVSRKDLHPNDWFEIWPELTDSFAA
ncbi:transcriptional regulator [Serratia marcescens]